uniref:Uncharacterized protein n=1 Tax=Cacopsylla melanoneura TaxID=428564 RepID=A0A8D9B4T0_9HEMI
MLYFKLMKPPPSIVDIKSHQFFLFFVLLKLHSLGLSVPHFLMPCFFFFFFFCPFSNFKLYWCYQQVFTKVIGVVRLRSFWGNIQKGWVRCWCGTANAWCVTPPSDITYNVLRRT